MSDADCCMLCCCCCSLLSLCNTSGTHPFCFSSICRCFRRRSKYDDDGFIDEVLEQHRAAVDPEGGYHIRQPEPVAQMGMQHIRSSSHQKPTSPPQQQPQHTRSPSPQQRPASPQQQPTDHPQPQQLKDNGDLMKSNRSP
ncbi:hypothetical protein P691DRAFT_573842 [Macrolepiota fuliginosa MF-IS2]|uniref:Uncharacterized protein n=1 Tax=Macrolepiota fuliginosa MF-IS2 TaxID=1400762 RepID=A0A9P6C270_9AGAR|nr:hypothetical protein P691DRAFT_573842 [Macrolepiota fuliginosa MF-IS2]